MVKFWRVLVVCVLLALTINIRVNFRCSFVDISPNASRRKLCRMKETTLEANELALRAPEC